MLSASLLFLGILIGCFLSFVVIVYILITGPDDALSNDGIIGGMYGVYMDPWTVDLEVVEGVLLLTAYKPKSGFPSKEWIKFSTRGDLTWYISSQTKESNHGQ
jgi:hypothetical protein